MKKIFLLISVLSFFIACNKDIAIVNTEIIINPFEPAPLDTIYTKLVGEASIDGVNVDIDSYEWKVLDGNNQELSIISADNEEMFWSPKDEGNYLIEVL